MTIVNWLDMEKEKQHNKGSYKKAHKVDAKSITPANVHVEAIETTIFAKKKWGGITSKDGLQRFQK